MTSTPIRPGLATPTNALKLAPSQYRNPPLPWTIRAMSRILSSKTPSVLGTVSIRAATSSVIAASSAARSIVPRALDLSSLTL